MAAKKTVTFESRLAEVEKLISEMENGGLPLETMLKRYEEGVKELNALEKELSEVTRRLTVIREGEDGKLTEEPLEVEE